MRDVRWADRYDLLAVVLLVAWGLVGGLLTGYWFQSCLAGAAVGSVAAYLTRRKAGLPDHALLGRLRGGGRRTT